MHLVYVDMFGRAVEAWLSERETETQFSSAALKQQQGTILCPLIEFCRVVLLLHVLSSASTSHRGIACLVALIILPTTGHGVVYRPAFESRFCARSSDAGGGATVCLVSPLRSS